MNILEQILNQPPQKVTGVCVVKAVIAVVVFGALLLGTLHWAHSKRGPSRAACEVLK
jgi:hypothetical protein